MEKISKKQRKEVVTKGFLVDYLDYILESKLEEKLESKNYVTKEYLKNCLEDYVTKEYLDIRLTEQTTEFKQYLDSLMEHQMHQLQVLMEQMDDRYVLRREWNATRGI